MEGIVGQGLSFNGVNNSINLGNTASLQFSSSWSAGGWVKVTGPAGITHAILSKGTSSSGGAGFHLNYQYSEKKFYIYYYVVGTAAIQNKFFTSTANPNAWHHVYATYDGSSIFLYLNGRLDASVNIGVFNPNSSANLRIGAISGNSAWWLQGQADEVRVYNRALSAAEVYELYRSGKR